MQADGDSARLDALRIFEELVRHEVNFVLVGGLAAQTHGNTRMTNDVDVSRTRRTWIGWRMP